MRAMTLTNPYAGLVAAGVKRIENRRTNLVRRAEIGVPGSEASQPFALHASREIDQGVYTTVRQIAPELFEGELWEMAWYKLSKITSAVIAVATIAGIIEPKQKAHENWPPELPLDQRRWYQAGKIGYVLTDIIVLTDPVSCPGMLGFWSLSPAIAELVQARIPDPQVVSRTEFVSSRW